MVVAGVFGTLVLIVVALMVAGALIATLGHRR